MKRKQSQDPEDEKDDLYIEGPISLTRHDHPVLGHTIYIFGDSHDVFDQPCPVDYNRSNVLHFKDFIHTLCAKHHLEGTLLDIFLEIDRFNKTEQKFTHYDNPLVLPTISQELLQQYHRQPYSSPYIRIHYTDLRMLCKHLYPEEVEQVRQVCTINKFLDTLWSLDTKINNGTIDVEYENHVIYQTVMSNLKSVETFLDELIRFEELSHLKKDILAIPFPVIREDLFERMIDARQTNLQIAKHIFDALNEYNHSIQELQDDLDLQDVYYEGIEALVYDLCKVSGYDVRYLMEYMDIYLLSRIFKTYRNGPDTKRVIIFVGETHAEAYRKQFSQWGFISQIIQSDNDYNCVRVPAEHLPFFRM